MLLSPEVKVHSPQPSIESGIQVSKRLAIPTPRTQRIMKGIEIRVLEAVDLVWKSSFTVFEKMPPYVTEELWQEAMSTIQ